MVHRNSFRLAVLTVVALAAATGTARAQVPIWESQWSPAGFYWAEARAMALTPDGDVVVTGSAVTWPASEFATARFAGGDGGIIWTQTRSFQPGSRNEPNGIAVDDAGNVFVCGETELDGDPSWAVVKYGVNGTEEWSVFIDEDSVGVATAVVADGAGGCHVAGYRAGAGQSAELVVAHYDAAGSETWSTRLSGEPGGDAAANALAACPAGYVYAAGYKWAGDVDKEAYWLVKLDAATGDTVWTRTYNGTASQWDPRDDRAHAIALGPGGNIYVTGEAGEYGSYYDATTVAWDSAGNELWVNRFDAGRLDEEGATEIAVCASGYVYCGGYTYEYHEYSELDFLVLRIRPDGETDWYRVLDGGVQDFDSCTGIAVDDAGNLYASGVTTDADGGTDWLIVKYNPAGQQVWLTTVGTPSEIDQPIGILLDDRGEFYVGGTDFVDGDDRFGLRKYGQYDVAATRIVAPADTLRIGANVWPRVWVVNNSPTSASFPVWCYIGNFYFDNQYVTGLAPYDSAMVEFRSWEVRDIGEHSVLFFTALPGDHQPSNDSVRGTVTTVPAWEQLADMPYSLTGRTRAVRDGGALVFVEDTLVFGFKGNNTTEFYQYHTILDTWVPLETLPAYGSSGRRRRVRRGARLTADGQGHIYALKGNNTLEFWRYDIRGDSVGWHELANYPLGTSGSRPRRLRGGSGLEYVESQNLIYSAKGSNTPEFYAYDIAGDSWLTMADVPPGPRNRRVRFGSCMVYDGDNTIYLIKGRTQEFYAYSVSADTWVAKPDFPDSEYGRRYRVNRGSGLAWDPENERVYATKGRRSPEWWYFDVDLDVWVEVVRDTIPTGPSGRPPCRGSAMTMGNGKVYFLRGNRTVEFWRYHADLPLNPGGGTLGGSMSPPVATTLRGPELTAVPNPFAGRAELRFALPRAGRAHLVLYDLAGREVRRLLDETRDAGSHSVTLSSSGLARGVYLARLTLAAPEGTLTAVQKVLVTR